MSFPRNRLTQGVTAGGISLVILLGLTYGAEVEAGIVSSMVGEVFKSDLISPMGSSSECRGIMPISGGRTVCGDRSDLKKDGASFSSIYGPGMNLSGGSTLLLLPDWTKSHANQFFPEFQEQYGGGGFQGASGLAGATLGLPPGVMGTRIVPVLTISERYDSNVFLAPNVVPGLQKEDFVTTVVPHLFVQRSGNFVDITVGGGALGEYYARNSELNYIGFNGNAGLNFNPLVNRYAAGATLYTNYAYFYSPTPPAFLTGGGSRIPVQNDQQSPQADIAPGDSFYRGILLSRINTTSHNATIGGSYPISSLVRIKANYGYSTYRFGGASSRIAASGTAFSPTASSADSHTVSAGPVFLVSPMDSISLSYGYTRSNFEAGSGTQGAAAFMFETHSLIAGWRRRLSEAFVFTASGGATLVKQSGVIANTDGGEAEPFLTHTGGAGLSWIAGSQYASFSYSVGAFPSYVGTTGTLLNNLVQVSVGDRQLVQNVGGFITVDFSDSQTIGSTAASNTGLTAGSGGDFSFRSYGTTEALSYRHSPTMVSMLSHTYQLFEGTSFASTLISGGVSVVHRQVVSLTLNIYWQ